ncbi:hypothetical protein Clacol_003094 [Clathrus columnatus]|uniref:F-box domain-containing protein n=1 Tax=Clathrus columnatus TaxID=1419009 RepID=A0AAV5A7Z8_9AGAM|nr:hypothetical protein Clacol_003094 [Clathrus columnatus]
MYSASDRVVTACSSVEDSPHPDFMASIFPIELFLNVASLIERRNDLLALAFTCHALYDILVPDYVDFVELQSPIFNNALWTRFPERPILYDRVRSLELTDTTTNGIHRYHLLQEVLLPNPIAEPLVYTVLPHLKNLRCFKGFFTSSSKISLSRLAQYLKQSGCILEELDLDLQKCIYTDYYRSIRCSSISSFALEMPSLKKLSISVSDYDKPEADGLIHMLSRLPNLSYLNLSPPNRDDHINDFLHDLFSKCNWPKLKHMVLKQIYQPNVIVESYGNAMSDFFMRHPELESFYIDNMLFSGCFVKDATSSSKLKALHFMFPDPAASIFVQIGRVLPNYLAKNLVHLSLIGISNVRLGIEPNGLCSLETCSLPRIVSETQLSWMAEFVKAAPNLKKCSVIQLLSTLRHLTHLINLLSNIDISESSGLDIFACLYEIPSLIYFNAMINSEGRQFIRILRNMESPQLSYEMISRSMSLAKYELDYTKWGGFLLRRNV